MNNSSPQPEHEVDDIEMDVGKSIQPNPPPDASHDDDAENWLQVKGGLKGLLRNIITKKLKFIP